MIKRIIPAAAILFLATLAAERAAAQASPADVTFEVPVNLTRLPSEITKIKLKCELASSAITQGYDKITQSLGRRIAEVELPVLQGEVVQTTQVVVPLSTSELNNPSGKQASYECRLFGYKQSQNWWQDFHTSAGNTPVFTLTPKPAPITGSFVW